jgi:hypothetical protein
LILVDFFQIKAENTPRGIGKKVGFFTQKVDILRHQPG